MKKAVVFMAIMLALIILSTGTVFAAENTKSPVFETTEMDGMTMTHLEPPGRVKQLD